MTAAVVFPSLPEVPAAPDLFFFQNIFFLSALCRHLVDRLCGVGHVIRPVKARLALVQWCSGAVSLRSDTQ